jgi:hypothetical protein
MPMEIERVKIGRRSGNQGTVTKSVSVSSRENFIESSKEETEILAVIRRCSALKNRANPIENRFNVCAVASQIVEYSSESCPILLNSSQHFQCSTYLNVKFHANSRRLQRDSYQRTVTHMRELAVPGTDQVISSLKSQTMPDSRSKRLKCLPARGSQRHPGAPAPQGQAAIVRLFIADCSGYDLPGQSKSPE